MVKANKLLNLMMNKASSEGEIINARHALLKYLEKNDIELIIANKKIHDEFNELRIKYSKLIFDYNSLKMVFENKEKEKEIIYRYKYPVWLVILFTVVSLSCLNLLGKNVRFEKAYKTYKGAFENQKRNYIELENEYNILSKKYRKLDKKYNMETILQPKPINEFDKLSEKKKNFFYMIMKYKGVENITNKDYDLFVKNFKDIKTTNVDSVLKKVYNIDRDKFNSLYKNSDTRNKAIRYYK